MYLQTDKYSASKGTLYGKRGELVRIVCESLPAVIVENDKGERYAVRFDEVGEDRPVDEVVEEVKPKAKPEPTKSKKVVKKIDKNTLF